MVVALARRDVCWMAAVANSRVLENRFDPFRMDIRKPCELERDGPLLDGE